MPPKKKSTKETSKKEEKSKKPSKKSIDTSSEESVPEDNISEKSDEEDVLSTDSKIDSETELKDCEIEQTIEDDNEFFDNDDSSEIKTDNEIKLITGKDRKTNARLTKYEMVRIIGERTKQLNMGAKPLVKNIQDIPYDKVAMEELKLNMIPFKIKRPLPNNKTEIWELSELDKSHLESLLN